MKAQKSNFKNWETLKLKDLFYIDAKHTLYSDTIYMFLGNYSDNEFKAIKLANQEVVQLPKNYTLHKVDLVKIVNEL